MKWTILILVAFILVPPHIVDAQKVVVSVMDLKVTSGISQPEGEQLTNKLLNELASIKAFDVIDRGKRDEILNEWKWIQSGACDQSSCLVEVGKMLGANKMIGGNIGKVGASYSVELQMVDVKTGKVEMPFSREYTGDVSTLLSVMKEAAIELSKWKPSPVALSLRNNTNEYGNLKIVSTPSNAVVSLDGQEMGKTPLLLTTITEGEHQLVIIKKGYEVYTVAISITSGSTINKVIALEKTISLFTGLFDTLFVNNYPGETFPKNNLSLFYSPWFETKDQELFDNSDGVNNVDINKHRYGIFTSGIRGLLLYGCGNSPYGGGLVYCARKYTNTQSNDFYDISAMENLASLKICLNSPPIYDSGNEKTFKHYNPDIIIWGHNNLIPAPNRKIFDYTYQDIYNSTFIRFFRLMAETYVYLNKKGIYEIEQKNYLTEMSNKNFNAPDYLNKRFSNVLNKYYLPNNGINFTVPLAIGFWLRRGIDKSHNELWIGLKKLFLLYDHNWFLNLIQNNSN